MTETTVMTKQEANGKLSDILKQVKSLMTSAENLADEYGLEFSSPIGKYGMGGWYVGKKNSDEDWSPSSHGWQASSQSC